MTTRGCFINILLRLNSDCCRLSLCVALKTIFFGMSNMRVAISNHADDNAQTKMSENEKGTELRQVKSAQFL